ncbi:MAG TPA: endolytic transglycosylase MltG [Solirubrobacterales bacterium]|nr:endolytic transglycosylase MltG [Solirubrobacterales bacterium]
MSDDWASGDPFASPDDPAAREREQRRREREEKRRERASKGGEKARGAGGGSGGDSSEQQRGGSVESPPDPPNERASRPFEREFWDEEGEVPPPVAPEPEIAPARSNGSGPRGPRGTDGLLDYLRRHPLRIFAAVAALFVLWFLFALFQPLKGDGSGEVAVAIPKGASVSEVGDLLGEKGVIDSSTLFQVRVTLAGKRSELYPGRYTLAEGMSYGAAIDALSQPPVKRTITVTVPEGLSRAQAAQLVEEIGLAGDYTKETVRSPYLNPARYGAEDAANLEGFLFPDTFEMKPNAPAADLVQLQLEDFKRRIEGVDMSYARSKNLTTYDVLIIASLIEDEAGVAGQRKEVAAVVYNRLREGIPLGIDATIRFATGNYTQPLTESELAVDSPYNTRLNQGLPPGPINSPGLDAIEAAAHPARSDFLYYVNEPGTCGKLAFSKTHAEFEADVARYNAARDAAGGEEPDGC